MMRNIKTFEGFFSFRKKDKLPKEENWKENLEWFFNNYKKLPNPSCEIKHKGTLNIFWTYKGGVRSYNIFPSDKDRDNPVVGISGLNYEEWPEISNEEFEEIRGKVLEVQNYLDEKEIKSNSNIGIGGLNMDIDETEMKVMNANSELNNHFKEYLDKSLQFEANYRLWSSESENEKMQHNVLVKVKELELGITSNPHVKLYCEINGENKVIDIFKNSLDEYIDLSDFKNSKYGFYSLRTHDDERNMTKKDIREKENNIKYPRILWMELIPNKWETIEFIKEIKNILNAI